MRKTLKLHITLLLALSSVFAFAQTDKSEIIEFSYEKAYELAYEGKQGSAYAVLENLIKEKPSDLKIKALYASANSWYGNYQEARAEFNAILIKDTTNRAAWISAVKNELYAKNYAIALGLANKALLNLTGDTELERLRNIAINGVNENQREVAIIDEEIVSSAKSKFGIKKEPVNIEKKIISIVNDTSTAKKKITDITDVSSFEKANKLAYKGQKGLAYKIVEELLVENPTNPEVLALYGSLTSWYGNYDKARIQFNLALTNDKTNRYTWISAIKNELYAKNYTTALGLANKALNQIPNDGELERLRGLSQEGVNGIVYDELGWHNTDGTTQINKKNIAEDISESPLNIEKQRNRVAVNNAATVFNERYDPIIFSSFSYLRKFKFGTVIPRLNYSNRRGINGIQFDLDMYPKIAKGLYAYVNYGYSNSEIYPTHKVGGDLYLNLKKGYEFSAGGRYIKLPATDVKVVTNSVGYYTGNYYFSLRSYVTPLPDRLTRASGNLLVRRYLKDADNFIGVNGGFGFSPEIRQFIAGGELLSETLLFIASQRLSFEYQFSSKDAEHIYRTNFGVTRQELAFAPGQYFYAINGGLTYEIRF